MYNLIFKISPNEFDFNIHKWESKNQSAIDKNSIKIIYKISKKFRIILESDKMKYKFYDMDNFVMISPLLILLSLKYSSISIINIIILLY